MTRIPLGHRRFAYIDDADLPHVRLHTWRLYVPSPSRTRATHYAVAKINKRNVYLHLFLWKLWGRPPVPIVDHWDGDGLHCTRENLRDCNVTQNNRNRGKLRNNTTGAKGVTYEGKRWRAKIAVDGTRLHLGYFTSLAAAAKAYDDAARTHHGAYAVLNGDLDDELATKRTARNRARLRPTLGHDADHDRACAADANTAAPDSRRERRIRSAETRAGVVAG